MEGRIGGSGSSIGWRMTGQALGGGNECKVKQ